MTQAHVILLFSLAAGLPLQSTAGGTPAEQKPRTVTARELNEGTTVIIGELGVSRQDVVPQIEAGDGWFTL